jgi:cell division protein FtsB
MSVNLGIWDKLTRLVIFLLFVAGLLGIAFWYLPLIRQNQRMRERILQLDARIQKEEEIGKHLRSSIDSLRQNPRAIERVARETFGYAKAGETVIYFEPAPTNTLHP